MNAFFNSIAFPTVLAAIGLTLALATGHVMDCRRNASRLWLKRSSSPTYYWFFVMVLGLMVALGSFIIIRDAISN